MLSIINKYKNRKKRWDDEVVEHWQDKITPPWRPSQGDIENYKRSLLAIKRSVKNILILGATPELRDLASQFGKQVWVADYSKNMLFEMSKLLKEAKLKREKLIVGDWCECRGLKKNSFDVILGDLVLRLISPKNQTIFLKKINRLLSPRGIFVTRVHFVKESLVKLSDEKVIEQSFSLFHSLSPDRQMEIKNLLISRILDKNYLLGNSEKIRIKAESAIKNYLSGHPKLDFKKKQILKDALNRFKKGNLAEFYSSTKKEIESQLRRFFVIKKRMTAGDYEDARYFPVYILKPRSRNKNG